MSEFDVNLDAPIKSEAEKRGWTREQAIAFGRKLAEDENIKLGAREGRLIPQSGDIPCPRYRYLATLLKRKARQTRMAYERWFERTYEKWRCIHEHEGAWNAATGNGYWGGLQMDWGFQHTYGPEFIRRYGLANRWPVWAQLVAAERAFYGFAGFGGRGYSPWGTRGMCGL